MIRKPAIGLGSSVDTCSDSLQAGRSGDRTPLEARLFALVSNSPEADPTSCTVGTGFLPGLKRLGSCVDQPSPSSAEVIERVEV
jgi:hypothetical protein